VKKEREEDKFFLNSFKCLQTVRVLQVIIYLRKKGNQENIENKENIVAHKQIMIPYALMNKQLNISNSLTQFKTVL